MAQLASYLWYFNKVVLHLGFQPSQYYLQIASLAEMLTTILTISKAFAPQ